MNVKGKELISEFLRYAVVGGIAFVVDFGIFTLLRETVYRGRADNTAVLVATAVGFVAGLIVNYILSMVMVFRKESQQKQGKTLKAVLIFVAVGLVGLVITELLQWLGESYFLTTALGESLGGIGKYAVRLCVTAIVLVWNYAGRKIFVFKGE